MYFMMIEVKLFPERHSEAGTAASDNELQQISRLKSEVSLKVYNIVYKNAQVYVSGFFKY